jgi:hypothetical protein
MALLGLFASLLFVLQAEVTLSGASAGSVAVLHLSFFLHVSISSGALRGVKRFKSLGFVSVSNALFKLLFGILFVALGFGVSGALLGVAAGMLIAMLISFIFLKPYFKINNYQGPDFSFSSFYSYSLPVLLAMVCFSIPSNLDVVFARYFFSANESGIYTSASVLGKIIFFFPAGIYDDVLMIARSMPEERTQEIYSGKACFIPGCLLGVGGSILLISTDCSQSLWPRLCRSPPYAPYGLAMFFFSLTAILMHYHLALKNMEYLALFRVHDS